MTRAPAAGAGTSTAQAPGATAERVLRGMYRRSGAWLLDRLGLVPAGGRPELAGHVPVEIGTAFAVGPDFERPVAGRSVVVGGACLTHCDARPERVRAEFVADTVQPLLLAAWAGVPCVLFLPVGEEMIVSDPSIGRQDWRRFGDGMEAFVRALAAAVPGGRPPVVVRTDAAETSAVLDRAVERSGDALAGLDLEDLYTVRPARAARRPPGPARLRQYHRSIVTYLPEVVSELAPGLDVRHVVVAENLHQAKAVRAAEAVAEAVGAPGRIDHLAHVPSPSVTGTGRMARAEDHSTLFCLDAPVVRAEKLARMPSSVRRFWAACFPEGPRPPHGPGAPQAEGDAVRLAALFDGWHRTLARATGTPAAPAAAATSDRTPPEGVTR
ncbi:hypothetical protein [Streptomyces chumphonensis]|uniref:hypothetical protein n=1 Tax=Streptomyces chumphonensis TaxID=1214925 RepID=UPI003D710EA5